MSYPSLAGMRVLDFGIITAGASTSAMLADLGAEVIKIEGPDYIDPFRVWTGQASAAQWWNASPHYAFTNRNKRNFCVDLKTPEGKALVLDLAASCDIVVENFRTGALDRLGLGFGELSRRRPNLVMASISSQGATGPEASSVSFGSTLEASCGLSSMIRGGDGAPLISGHGLNYPDQIASLFAVGMILCALVDRETRGQPVHLDISQRELAAYMLGEYLMAAPDAQAPAGPGAPSAAQQLVRCEDGLWVALTVPSPAVMERVAAALSLAPARFAQQLSAWAATQASQAAVSALRAAGVSAEPCRTAAGLLDDDTAGSPAFARDPAGRPVKGLPWQSGARSAGVDRAAPGLGADNHFVACEILGLDATRYAELVAQGVLSQSPRETAHAA
jgi:benzylsuccinate CoA-transferase BbsF subunit